MGDAKTLSDLKQAFNNWIEGQVVILEDDEMPPGAELSEEDRGLREDQKRWDKEASQLLDALQLCTDPMPEDICFELDLPAGSTYAQAVRQIRDNTAAAKGRRLTVTDLARAARRAEEKKHGPHGRG